MAEIKLVCVPWGRQLDPAATKGTCSECGKDVAITPQARKVLAEHPQGIVCSACAFPHNEPRRGSLQQGAP